MSIYLTAVQPRQQVWMLRTVDNRPELVSVRFERWANAARSAAYVVVEGEPSVELVVRSDDLWSDELEACRAACSRCDCWAYRFGQRAEKVAIERRRKGSLVPTEMPSRGRKR